MDDVQQQEFLILVVQLAAYAGLAAGLIGGNLVPLLERLSRPVFDRIAATRWARRREVDMLQMWLRRTDECRSKHSERIVRRRILRLRRQLGADS
jgi:hypothetical protein